MERIEFKVDDNYNPFTDYEKLNQMVDSHHREFQRNNYYRLWNFEMAVNSAGFLKRLKYLITGKFNDNS